MKQQAIRLFLLIFTLALVVRLAGIDRFPPGLWMDEGLNGVDAWRSLHDGPMPATGIPTPATGLKMVYPDIAPREPLLVWILSVVLWLGGPKILLMRLVMVLIGSLACGAFLLMVLSVERRRGVSFALAAAFVLATLHWHSHFSRIVFRTNLVPLLEVAVVGAMALAARRRCPAGHRSGGFLLWFAVGSLAGVGFYSYLSWYFFLPVLLVWFWAFREPEEGIEKYAEGGEGENFRISLSPLCLIAFLAGALVVAGPLFWHYLSAPDDLTGRAGALSPFLDGYAAGFRLMARNALDVLLMFSFRGDHVPLHNIPLAGGTRPLGTAVLDPVWSVFFMAGLLRGALVLRKGGAEGRRALAWIAWLVCMSMPSVASQTDSANTLRNLGATPAVAYFTATGWWWGWTTLRSKPKTTKGRLRIALLIALIWGAGFQVDKSWRRHPQVPGIEQAFSDLHIQLAHFCRPDPSGAPLFIDSDISGHKTFEFLTIGREDIRPLDLAKLFSKATENQEQKPSDHRVLCTQFNAQNWRLTAQFPEALQALFPRGRFELPPPPIKMGDPPLPYALIFRIPAASLLSPEKAKEEARKMEKTFR